MLSFKEYFKEVRDLEEISKATLGSYVKKATQDVGKHEEIWAKRNKVPKSKRDSSHYSKLFKSFDKQQSRQKNIKKAQNRISNGPPPKKGKHDHLKKAHDASTAPNTRAAYSATEDRIGTLHHHINKAKKSIPKDHELHKHIATFNKVHDTVSDVDTVDRAGRKLRKHIGKYRKSLKT